MKIALGSDHAGLELKEKIKKTLQARGIEVADQGTNSPESVDYPDYARKVGEQVAGGSAEKGILVCGSGIGMAIAANKVPGIRAANISSQTEAELSRQHNDLNVLTLGQRLLKEDEAMAIVDKWLATPFSGGRHAERVAKIAQIEREEKLQPISRSASKA